MNLEGKKVLVIGGTGSVGGPLVQRLVTDCGAQVRVMARNLGTASRIARFPIELVPGDIADPAAVQKAMEGRDIVFNLAYGKDGDRKQQERITIAGTENVLKAALEHKLERVVHVSTISVYGNTNDGDMNETAPRKRSGEIYADSKLKAEKLAFQYFRKYGLPVSIIQPTIIYGPFVGGWTVRVINQLKNELVILPDGGEGLCNAVYVDDVVEALLLAATKEEAIGEAFLISGEEPVSWREFYGAYENMLGTSSLLLPSQSEIKALNRRYKREQRTIHQISAVLRKPDVLLWILELPAMKNLVTIARKIVPISLLRKLLRRVILSDNQGGLSVVSREKPYKPLTDMQEREFRARTRVRIDKAKRLLGYQPGFALEEGMQPTEMWARYANLL